jgi:hypothetical protein
LIRSSVLASRLRSQLVTGEQPTSVAGVAAHLLAIQAQDLRGARLAVRLRSQGLVAVDVDAALSDERSVVVAWLNRGTLHLVPSADYWWLRELTVWRLRTGNRRRLAQEGVSPQEAERGVGAIGDALSNGPHSRAELKAVLDRSGVPTAGQALVHLLIAASIAMPLVRGPLRGGEHCFVDARDWLGGPPDGLDREEGLRRLASRYLVGHGPAEATDLAKWAGVGLQEARRGLAAARDEVSTVGADLFDLAGRGLSSVLPGPLLAGPFDPLLHGWASNAEILDGRSGIVTTNGLFRPFALIDGRAAATWGLAGGRIVIRPFRSIGRHERQALQSEAHAVLAYLGLPPTAVTFDGSSPLS